MVENYSINKKKKTKASPFIMILLYISFAFISVYPTSTMIANSFHNGFGNILNLTNPNSMEFIFLILAEGLISWGMFEMIFYIYRFIISVKVYSLVVPLADLKNETRTFFIYRNIIYGIFINLCFFFPFINKFMPFVSLVVFMTFLLIFSSRLTKKYGESIIGHFVFKSFCYPVFIYESVVLVLQILGVI